MKRFTALAMTLCILVSVCMLDTNAYTESEQSTADALNSLDMFKGTSATETVYNLDGELNRYEGYALLVRMMGADKEAASGYASGKYRYTFTDTISNWAKPYVAYAQSTGLTKGVGDGKSFGGESKLNEKMFLTMSLRSLGYSDSGANPDFQWGTVMSIAEKVGLISGTSTQEFVGEMGELSLDHSSQYENASSAGTGVFTRGNTVSLFWTTLNTPLKGSTKTLSDKLIEEGVITKEAFAVAMQIKEPVQEQKTDEDNRCYHTETYSVVTIEPTCKVSGLRVHYCKSCKAVVSKEVLPKLTHQYVGVVTKEPACTKAGVKTYTCSLCGDSYTEEIMATGHGQAIYDNDATYHWTVCSVCGEKLSSQVKHSFNANSECTVCGHGCKHDYQVVVTKPTCTAMGYTTKTCKHCGRVEIVDYTDVIQHEYVVKVTAPTCTEQGYTTHTCKHCNHTVVDTFVAARGHSYVGTLTKAPTCTATGTISYTCKYCGDQSLGTVTLPALGHSYELVEEHPATKNAVGYKRYRCSVCGDTYDIPLYWSGTTIGSSELPEDNF